MKRCTSFVAAVVILAIWQSTADAALYWNANGSLGGNGTWDVNTTQNWSTTNAPGPADSTWTPNDGTQDAEFNGSGSYTVTIPDGTTINAKSIALGIAAGNTTITGGTIINISDPTNSILMNTNTSGSARAQIIASPISGTDITVVPNATGSINSFLTLGANATGATNTFTGDLIFGGPTTATGFSQININNPTALPSTATVRMKRGLSQLLFTAGGVSGTVGYTATFNNNIILNDSGSGSFTQAIGASAGDAVITLGGVISGDANLVFQVGNGGGNGTIVLANNATYTGNTNVNSQTGGVVRLGVNDALPVGTNLAVNRGRFDLAGLNQRVAGLNSNTNGNGFVTNTGGTTSTLTIDGNATGTFTSLIGASDLSSSNDNIALALAATNTGTLTLNRGAGNTYNGGTTIDGGRLVAAAGDVAVSATGTGPVAVNNGGTLGGTGGVGGPITVASGGHLAPGLATGNGIGTLSALDSVSLASGSSLDINLGAPGTSDRVDMPNFFGSFALTVPAAANSIGVNLSDPAGAAAGNGIYTLMTFQAGQYTGSNNASPFFTSSLPSPNSLNGATIAYNLADDSNTIQDGNPSAATRVIMTVTGGPNALTWTGAASGIWDTGTTANFNNIATSTSTTFASNDNVTFDDAGANTDVTIAAGGVQPNVVVVNNSTSTYTFSGGDIEGSSVGGGGGLILDGTGPLTINSNYTAAGPIVSNKSGTGTATFNGNITAATSLTVNGGAVTLAGANTYPGDNTVNGGSLTASGAAATFGGGDVTVNAGSAAISAGVLDAILDTATLTLAGGGTANMADVGFINLGDGIDERIGSLVLGTSTFTSGTFGATGSGATNIFDEYFLGSGIITVGGGLPGDYNNDGKVDAADYVVWRKNPAAHGGDPAGYNTWRTNFGAMSGGGSSSSAPGAVPEPACFMLLFVGLSGIWIRRRHR
ncbi:MAG TPA: PEP-CTERM sorting domain-containing protein [Lacipirellulaceae bacterium]